MTPRPKMRKSVKWAGAVLVALMFVAWLASARFLVAWTWRSGWVVGIQGGKVGVAHDPIVLKFLHPGLNIESQRWELRWDSKFKLEPTGEMEIYTPLTFLMLPVLPIAAAAWWLDAIARRRARFGMCVKCGYDLAGTPVGEKCPECGAIQSKARPRSE